MTQTLALLAANEVSLLIGMIERDLPGYWYSISQKKHRIRISLGPSEFCVLDTDRAWSKTREGDSGIIVDIPRDASYTFEKLLAVFEDKVMQPIREVRECIGQTLTASPPYKAGRRVHTREDRHRFKKRYGQFLRDMGKLVEHMVDLTEVYLGSCQLSADVSLRGVGPGKVPFDVGVDLTGTSLLDKAFGQAYEELLEDYVKEKA